MTCGLVHAIYSLPKWEALNRLSLHPVHVQNMEMKLNERLSNQIFFLTTNCLKTAAQI